MDQHTGSRPIADVVAEEFPVSGVVFAEGKAPEKYVEEPDAQASVSGFRAVLGAFFRM